MKKKGFTLIELLAVIVILAIISLITVPMILGIIEKARKAAAETSVLGYVDAIEKKIVTDTIENKNYENKDNYNYDEIKVDIKGQKPTSGLYSLQDGLIVSGSFCMNGYTVDYVDNKATATKKCGSEDLKLSGHVKLSSNLANMNYSETITVEITENTSNGELSCESSNNNIATCSISGNTMTIVSKTTDGDATLTVKSKATDKYKEAQAAFVVTIGNSLLSVTANDYNGVYDGNNHGITVISSGATIKYGTENGIYNLDASPSYSDVGTYTVYYQVSKEGYKTVTGSKTITITKADGNISLSNVNKNIYVGSNMQITASNATGTINCLSNNDDIATCTVNNNIITIEGKAEGDAIITINVAASNNYKSTSKTLNVIVKNGSLNDFVKLGEYIYMTPEKYDPSDNVEIEYPCELAGKTGTTCKGNIFFNYNIWRVIKINDDGTIEMVAEYSNGGFTTYGLTGYLNYTAYSNYWASQFENSKYTIGSRSVGYNGQTEKVSNSKFTGTTQPFSTATVDNSNETLGGGDILYENDLELIQNVLGTLKYLSAPEDEGGTAVNYSIASRKYGTLMGNYYWQLIARYVDKNGEVSGYSISIHESDGYHDYSYSMTIRPILTLKAGLKATGSGTKEDPYKFQ